uniref:ARAD1B08404p n=1 Tax=Blastobotrys adeninivorans TaxID=409370 RepID=A0A060TAP4_BLAAD
MRNSETSPKRLSPLEVSASSPPTPAPSPTPNFYFNKGKLRWNYREPSPGDGQYGQFGSYLPSASGSNPSGPSASAGANSSNDHHNHHNLRHHAVRPGERLFEETKEAFSQLSREERRQYLYKLLGMCDREVLSKTLEHIEPMLKRDPFKFFPNEISLRILSYIDDPTSLARASQVSRLWYLLLSDDLTWKELCKTHHFRRLSATNAYRRMSRMSLGSTDGSINTVDAASDDLSEAIYDPDATKNPVARSYRSHFKHQYLLNNAWNSGGRLAARYVISHPGVVTSLIMDQKYIVIALDNSKIYVLREDGKMLRTLFGHVMGVWALTLHGNTLVSGGCDRDVRVWDLKTGNCLQILRGHSSTVRCLQMVDAHTAVSGSRDTTIRVWDLERGVCRRVLSGHTSSVRCLEVVGDICVSGSYDFTAMVWRISDGTLLHTLTGHFSQIYCLAFDGERIATGSLDSSVRIWSPHTGECLAVLQGHTSLVGQVQMKGDTLVTGGSDGAVRVWDLNTYTCVQRFAAHDNTTTTLQFDENRIVSGGSDGRVRVWDIKTGHHIRDLSSQFDAVWRIAFRHDKVCILASRQNNVYMELTSFTPPKEDFDAVDVRIEDPMETDSVFSNSKYTVVPDDDALSPKAIPVSEATPGPSTDLKYHVDPLDRTQPNPHPVDASNEMDTTN